MAQGKRPSRAKIKAAIANSGGIIERVAKKAELSWATTRDYLRNDPELSAMMEAEAERINDAAENTIISKIMEGDDASAKWWLARTRRAKFGDNVDVTSGGQALKIVVEYADTDPDTTPTA